MAYPDPKCNWCGHQYNSEYGNYSDKLQRGFCSNRCKHSAENADIQSRPIQNVVQKVEKTVYVDKTSPEEKDQMRASAELLRQRARQLKREQDLIDQQIRTEQEIIDSENEELEQKKNKKWILLLLFFLWITLNIATIGKPGPWIISNLFILFYIIYFFFQKKTKKVGEWLDDKLNQ